MNAFPEDGDAQAGDGPVEDCEVDDGLECDAGGDSEAPEGRKKQHDDLVHDWILSGQSGWQAWTTLVEQFTTK